MPLAEKICILLTLFNVAVAVLTWSFFRRTQDQAKNVDFWFMQSTRPTDDDDD